MTEHPPLFLHAPTRRPRVVMCVTNPFTHDTRIDKQARSLAAIGCEVHVLCVAGKDLAQTECRDGIHIERFAMTGHPLRMIAPFLALIGWSFLARFLMAVRGKQLAAKPAAPLITVSTESPRPKSLARRIANRLPNVILLSEMNFHFARRILELRADLVECHDATTLLAGLMARRIGRIPFIYDSHELFLERNIGNRARWLDRLMWRPIEQRGITQAEAVFSVADGICRHLARQYSIRAPFLIRNVQPFEPPPARTRLLAEELRIPAGKAIAIYAGAIVPNRGLEVLIESSKHLDNAVVVIMGYSADPLYGNSLIKLADNLGVLGRSVHFRDAVPMGDVIRYLASADLGIVPTQNACLSYFYEASNKIFHCMMAGLPLAMSDHKEKRLIVELHGVGVLFDERDPLAIAVAVNGILADRVGYERMRQNCLNAARQLNWQNEEYKLRRVVGKLLDIHASLIPPPNLESSQADTDLFSGKARQAWV